MIRYIKTHDVPGFATVDEALAKLEAVLEELTEISADVVTAEDAEIMKANIQYMKSYYERIERLLIDEKNQAQEVTGHASIKPSTDPENSSQDQVAPAQSPSADATHITNPQVHRVQGDCSNVGSPVPGQRKKVSWGTAGLIQG